MVADIARCPSIYIALGSQEAPVNEETGIVNTPKTAILPEFVYK